MNCVEFQRLSLSDPHNANENFVEHSKGCVDCLRYVQDVRKMDSDLAASLAVAVPADLTARLLLNQELAENAGALDAIKSKTGSYYAIAASVAVALFIAGFMLSNQLGINPQISEDYEELLAGVVEHMSEHPFTPVWEPERANSTVNTLLSSYDGELQLKNMQNLQFSRLCPMGQYHGLHATLQTDDGQITFAYIKGSAFGDLYDTAYEGYVTRIKPVRGGSLVIVSRNKKSLEQADQELKQSMYWDI